MSGAMIVQAAAAVRPPTSLGLAAAVARAAWYPLHDAAGTATVECALGLGESLTRNGTEGTFWTATWGAATPTSGSSHRLSSAANPAYLGALLRLDTLAADEILIGYELQHDGDQTASEAVFSVGRAQALAGSGGGYSVSLSSVEQTEVQTHGGADASAPINTALSGSASTGVTARTLTVLSITLISAGNIRVRRYSYRVGTGYNGANSADINVLASGGAMPAMEASSLVTLMARQTSPSAFDRYLASAGSNASLNNFWAARLTAADGAAAEAALAAMVAAPREFPLSLRATS
jgi:hypothetical protein